MVDFSGGNTQTELTGLFTKYDLRGVLEENEYHSLDMAFPSVAGQIDRATEFVEQASITKWHTMCIPIWFVHSKDTKAVN